MCVVVGQVGQHPVGKMSQYSGKVSGTAAVKAARDVWLTDQLEMFLTLV